MSVLCDEKVYEARENVTTLIPSIQPENIIFTQNATHGLNIAIKGLIKDKCHVIISDLEHNSVIRPLNKEIAKYGGTISIYDSDIPIREAVPPLITPETRLIISTMCSNVTGKEIDYKELCKIAKEYGIKLILDASQYLGHKEVEISPTDFDFIIAPGHKALFGLQGVGIMVMGKSNIIDTLIEGGNGMDTFNLSMPHFNPERYEAGTLPTPSIIGLSEGIKFINEVGIKHIKSKIDLITDKFTDALYGFKDLTIYGASNGIVSFNVKDIPSSCIAKILSEKNIASRAGFHCAPLIHRKLGTEQRGAVRLSLSYLNSLKDVDCVYKAIKDIYK